MYSRDPHERPGAELSHYSPSNHCATILTHQVKLPHDPSNPLTDPSQFDQNQKNISGSGISTGPNRIEIEKKILHEGEVNRARYMPQKPNIVATKTVQGPVLLFDYSKHPKKPTNDNLKPDLKLVGHTG